MPINSDCPGFNLNFKDKYWVVLQIPFLDFFPGLETFSQLVHEDDYGSVSIAINQNHSPLKRQYLFIYFIY